MHLQNRLQNMVVPNADMNSSPRNTNRWYRLNIKYLELLIFIVLAVGVVSVAIEKARKIPVAKGQNLDRLAKANRLQRGYMESDDRLRKRIAEAIKPKDRRPNK